MKRIAVLFVLLTALARADWKDLKEGLDPASAEHCAGAPLFSNRSRGGTYVNWIYDNGGFILFENGRVRFWQQPAAKAGALQALPVAAPVAPAPTHPKENPAAPVPMNRENEGALTLHW